MTYLYIIIVTGIDA